MTLLQRVTKRLKTQKQSSRGRDKRANADILNEFFEENPTQDLDKFGVKKTLRHRLTKNKNRSKKTRQLKEAAQSTLIQLPNLT